MNAVTRRRFLGGAAATAAGATVGPWVLRAHAQSGPLKVGLVLPYTGAYAVLGESITQGMELVFARENWTVAGRKVEMIKEDDEMKPPVGIRNKVHSSKTILIVSNAGADDISRAKCSKWIFRTSFSNWQPNWPMGPWVAKNVSKE